MQTSPVSMLPSMPSLDTASLAASSVENPEDVAQSFESVFASLLIKEMRKTLSEGLFGSDQSDVLGGLFDLHMGQAMANGPGLGIKQIVLSQLQSHPSQDAMKRTTA